MDAILSLAELSGSHFALGAAAVFVAGVVRGFSGFALSAMAMAILVAFLPPIELIVICWFLEMSASLLMVRGGVQEWDRKMVYGLLIGSSIGLPIGLYFTNSLPVETSKIVALCVILTLAILQVLKVRAAFLATQYGVIISGVIAGTATGLASVGGMVVALYVLAREASAVTMRASLVMYLFLGSLVSFLFLNFYGMMDTQTVMRGLVWTPACMFGVFVGKTLFRPEFEKYYKPFCLLLLIFLASTGLARMFWL